MFIKSKETVLEEMVKEGGWSEEDFFLFHFLNRFSKFEEARGKKYNIPFIKSFGMYLKLQTSFNQ